MARNFIPKGKDLSFFSPVFAVELRFYFIYSITFMLWVIEGQSHQKWVMKKQRLETDGLGNHKMACKCVTISHVFHYNIILYRLKCDSTSHKFDYNRFNRKSYGDY